MITIFEKTWASGYQSPIYGFTPCRKTRYVLDISCSSASIRIGGASSFSLGSGSHQNVVVDSDASLRRISVTVNGVFKGNYSYVYSWHDGQGFTFTPYSAIISGSGITLHSIKQQIEDKGLVTAIGGNSKYQALGYDGPHAPGDTQGSLTDIRDAGMEATLFVDHRSNYMGLQLPFLKDLVLNYGFDLGTHFGFYNGNTLPWEEVKDSMIFEYNKISAAFDGRPLTCWCVSGIGYFSADYKNVWVKDNLDMFLGRYRVREHAITILPALWNDTYTRWIAAWNQGSAEVPAYMHRTDGTYPPSMGSQLDGVNWDKCFNAMLANGIKVTGFANVYFMGMNQEDATFITSQSGDNLLITPTTNGYPAFIVVKVDANEVTGVYEGGVLVPYEVTPENYVTFMVEHGKTYTVSGGDPPPMKNLSVDANIPVPFNIRKV